MPIWPLQALCLAGWRKSQELSIDLAFWKLHQLVDFIVVLYYLVALESFFKFDIAIIADSKLSIISKFLAAFHNFPNKSIIDKKTRRLNLVINKSAQALIALLLLATNTFVCELIIRAHSMKWTETQAMHSWRVVFGIHLHLVLDFWYQISNLQLLSLLRNLLFDVLDFCFHLELIQKLLRQHLLQAWTWMIQRIEHATSSPRCSCEWFLVISHCLLAQLLQRSLLLRQVLCHPTCSSSLCFHLLF